MLDMRPHAEMTTMERGDENAFAIADTAIVSNYAVLGEAVSIGEHSVVAAGCVVGAHAVIGADCLIHPHVTIYPGVVIGNHVVVHAGAVLGADGFGYVRDESTGAYVQFPQQGSLVIEDDVEIGANTTIDRGALDETRIGRGTKLDNLVHVGHNVRIGKNVAIAAQTGISGSSSVGDGAVIAGQVGIGDHAEVGEGVILGGRAGVLNNKKLHGAGKLFWGTPARPVREYLKELAALGRLGKK
jgi:UDP-3-O-[3-hydroxymyristoyl] glucosamine N-acyltransferase